MYTLEKSPRSDKKYRVTTPTGKKVDFGATGYSDYTLHKDKERQERYINRHQARENWDKSGIDTAGFWSRWLLWNKPDFNASLQDIQKRFNISIKNLTSSRSEGTETETKTEATRTKTRTKTSTRTEEELVKYCEDNKKVKYCNDEKFWKKKVRDYLGYIPDMSNISWKKYYAWLIFNM
jgi:hypothetical protein